MKYYFTDYTDFNYIDNFPVNYINIVENTEPSHRQHITRVEKDDCTYNVCRNQIQSICSTKRTMIVLKLYDSNNIPFYL